MCRGDPNGDDWLGDGGGEEEIRQTEVTDTHSINAKLLDLRPSNGL